MSNFLLTVACVAANIACPLSEPLTITIPAKSAQECKQRVWDQLTERKQDAKNFKITCKAVK